MDVINVCTPMFLCSGGQIYKISFETEAAAIRSGASDIETRINLIQKQLAKNTTTYFTDSEDKLAALAESCALCPGDQCLVVNSEGAGSMHMWLPANRWLKLYDLPNGGA